MNLLHVLQGGEGIDIVRKGRNDFELAGEETLLLTREVGRKIWFCLYAQKVSRSMFCDPEDNNWGVSKNLMLRILVDSNCHGIVDWLLRKGPLVCQGYDIQFDDIGAHYNYRPQFNSSDLIKLLQEDKFPIFATSWSDDYFSHDHSIVILGRSKTEGKMIVFEKQGIQGCPFRVYTERIDKLKHNYVAFTT